MGAPVQVEFYSRYPYFGKRFVEMSEQIFRRAWSIVCDSED